MVSLSNMDNFLIWNVCFLLGTDVIDILKGQDQVAVFMYTFSLPHNFPNLTDFFSDGLKSPPFLEDKQTVIKAPNLGKLHLVLRPDCATFFQVSLLCFP